MEHVSSRESSRRPHGPPVLPKSTSLQLLLARCHTTVSLSSVCLGFNGPPNRGSQGGS